MLLTYSGPSALSQFRLAPLLEACRQRAPHIGRLEATHLYLAWTETQLDEGATRRLGQLLDGRRTDPSGDGARLLIALEAPLEALPLVEAAAIRDPQARLLLPKVRLESARARAGEDPEGARSLLKQVLDDPFVGPAVRSAAAGALAGPP